LLRGIDEILETAGGYFAIIQIRAVPKSAPLQFEPHRGGVHIRIQVEVTREHAIGTHSGRLASEAYFASEILPIAVRYIGAPFTIMNHRRVIYVCAEEQ
jgi:hypothetical protein